MGIRVKAVQNLDRHHQLQTPTACEIVSSHMTGRTYNREASGHQEKFNYLFISFKIGESVRNIAWQLSNSYYKTIQAHYWRATISKTLNQYNLTLHDIVIIKHCTCYSVIACSSLLYSSVCIQCHCVSKLLESRGYKCLLAVEPLSLPLFQSLHVVVGTEGPIVEIAAAVWMRNGSVVWPVTRQ